MTNTDCRMCASTHSFALLQVIMEALTLTFCGLCCVCSAEKPHRTSAAGQATKDPLARAPAAVAEPQRPRLLSEPVVRMGQEQAPAVVAPPKPKKSLVSTQAIPHHNLITGGY